jgi:beta-glucosidase
MNAHAAPDRSDRDPAALEPDALGARFPPRFAWGFAASAYQIDGAAHDDGRGTSIWDTFSRAPGAIADGSNGDIACDHYHRFRDDVALMGRIGATAYRFSVSWPRVLPDGTGEVNERGLDFYDRLVDALLAAGVVPLVNLFHWDLPQALQDEGGFADRRAVDWFVDYAANVASRLGDRVSDWMTFNEPAVFAFLGHAEGVHAPGLRDWPAALRVADNQLRAHAASGLAIRSLVRDARIGIAIDVNRVAPATGSERDRVAAAQWSAARDGWFLDPLFGRGYPQLGLEAHRAAGHLDGVDLEPPPAGNLDYLGLNYYRRDSVRALSDRPFDWTIGARPGTEQTQMEWEVAPDGLRDGLIALHEEYAPLEIVVTENGAAYPDTVEPGGRVRDADRTRYLARHVSAAAEALQAGVPLTGYHVWSALDNYEWSFGYTRRFGLIHVDFETQRRTLKESADWFARLIAASR